MEEAKPEKRTKGIYVGAPACFQLDLACQYLIDAFGGEGHPYLVGSALQTPDWRDIDVRYILPDEEFEELFPKADKFSWELDTRWKIMNIAISLWLKSVTGLPVDFQFQPRTEANKRFNGIRSALGMTSDK